MSGVQEDTVPGNLDRHRWWSPWAVGELGDLDGPMAREIPYVTQASRKSIGTYLRSDDAGRPSWQQDLETICMHAGLGAEENVA